MSKVYVMYDGRAGAGDPEDTTVLMVAQSEDEVADGNRLFVDIDYTWYEYEDVGGDLIDERWRPDLETKGLSRKNRKR